MTTMPGMKGQVFARDLTIDASGTIATGGTAQLALPERKSTTMLLLQNQSTTVNLTFVFGSALLSCALTGTGVSGITIINAGFNFTRAPILQFLGGGWLNNTAQVATGLMGFDSPTHVAMAHCVMVSATPLPGLKIGSVVIDDPGTGYHAAPYVWVTNDPLDPLGAATPVAGAAGGITLTPLGSLSINDFTNPTDQIAVLGASTGAAYTIKWRP